MVSEGRFLKIWDYIDEAKEAGYTFLCGGDRESASRKSGNICRKEMKETLGEMNEGYFITPCILVDVPTTSRIWREEVFGPVLCVRVSHT